MSGEPSSSKPKSTEGNEKARPVSGSPTRPLGGKDKTSKESKDKKTKAQIEREERDAVKAAEKARADAEAKALKKAAREKAKLEPPKPPKDTRSKAQKDRDERDFLKEQMGLTASKDTEFGNVLVPNSKTKIAKDQHVDATSEIANATSEIAKDQHVDATSEGLEIINDLLADEPGEVTDWFMTQVRKAGKTDKGVEELPLYKFACAVNSATDAQRQQLAKAAISGYGAMPAEDRAQVLALLVANAEAAQPPSTENGAQESQHTTNNLRKIVAAARLDKMPSEEKDSLILTAQAHALEYATPSHISEMLTHMSTEERKELSSALVKTKFIPADQACLIDEIVQPEGILDEVGAVSSSASGVYRDFLGVLAALPFLEWICARRWEGSADCSSSLVQWLHTDACLTLAMVFFALVGYQLLAPAYDVLSADPTGALRRWQSSNAAGADFDTSLQNTIRIGATAYRLGLAATIFSAFLAVASGVYAGWAIFLLLDALTGACIGLSVLFETTVIALRFTSIAAVLYIVYRIVDVLQHHKFLGSSGILTTSLESGYGSMEEADVNSKV